MAGLAFIFIIIFGSLMLFREKQEEFTIEPTPEQPAAVLAEAAPNMPKTHHIELGEDYAKPDYLVINKGDTVVWTSVKSGTNRRRFWIDEEIYSDLLDPGESYSYTFNEAGDHTFRDVFNGLVVGAIVVKSPPVIQITGSFLKGFSRNQRKVIGIQFLIFVLAVGILLFSFRNR